MPWASPGSFPLGHPLDANDAASWVHFVTDQPTQPPEQRLPATRPPDQVTAERFTAAPPIKAIDGLTPERARIARRPP